tara:strand:- start:495 stop:1268 length:774 start_codon:yes stop_codon:yes gene_type:complete
MENDEYDIQKISKFTNQYLNKTIVNNDSAIIKTTTYSFIIMTVILSLITIILISNIPVVYKSDWSIPLYISIAVVFVATCNFIFMTNYWRKNKTSPTIYRYIDWIITVPLQLVEFYFIIYYSGIEIPDRYFIQLFTAGILMILFGWLGESGKIPFWWGFIIGMFFWIYIIFELFYGKLAEAVNKISDCFTKKSYSILKWIIFIGWSIYPIGYITSKYKNGLWKDILYNFGDLINKITFVIIIAAVSVINSNKKNVDK